MKDEKNQELSAMDDMTLEEQIEIVAGCNYTLQEMAIYFSEVINPKEFLRKAEDPDSIVYLAIQRGILKTEFAISAQQKALAESGNITAVQTFEKIRERKSIQQIKNKIWFGT